MISHYEKAKNFDVSLILDELNHTDTIYTSEYTSHKKSYSVNYDGIQANEYDTYTAYINGRRTGTTTESFLVSLLSDFSFDIEYAEVM